MKKKILIISIFIFCKNVYSQGLDNLNTQKKILQELPFNSNQYWNNLYSIQSNLMTIENRINYLTFILQDKIDKNQFSSKNDPQKKIQRAKRHLLLKNPQAAIDEIKKNLNYIDLTDKKNIFQSYRILFEAQRMQKNFEESANICSKIILIENKNSPYFDDKWKMLCSYAFLQESKKNKSKKFRKNFLAWSLNPISTISSRYSLMNHILIALSLRNVSKNKIDSITSLKSAIATSKERDVYLGRAYLTLSLLYFENGENKKSFSIIQNLANNSRIDREGYKYFEVDDYTRLLAKLCFARLHATYGNLQAAQTWYQNILQEKWVSGSDFATVEKNKIKFEYAQNLYMQNKFKKSANILKSVIEEDKPNNLFLSNYNIKISKIILANILNKSLTSSNEGENELIRLYRIANFDLDFIKKISNEDKKDYESIKKHIIPLAALAKNYGLESIESKYFIENYISLQKASENLPKIQSDFVNSLNAVDYTDKGLTESIVLSCIEQINKNFSYIKNNMFQLDEISYTNWNKDEKSFSILDNNRQEIIRRINALDDEVSIYNNKSLMNNISKSDILNELKLSNRYLNYIKSLNANLNFLSFEGIDAGNEKSYYDLKEKIASLVLYYRKSILADRIFPVEFYEINKKSDVYSKSLQEIHLLHSYYLSNKINSNKEKYNLIEKNWKKIIELNLMNNQLIQIVNNRLNENSQSILKSIVSIENKVTKQQDLVNQQKTIFFAEYENKYPLIIKQTTKRINEFNDYIKLSLAVRNKNIYEISKNSLIEENELKEQRIKWINSLNQSLDWGLNR